MWNSRSITLAAQLAVLTTILAGCERQPQGQRAELRTRIDEANMAAVRFLLSKQSADGAWRSETYGTLTDGITLTGPVMKALMYVPPGTVTI